MKKLFRKRESEVFDDHYGLTGFSFSPLHVILINSDGTKFSVFNRYISSSFIADKPLISHVETETQEIKILQPLEQYEFLQMKLELETSGFKIIKIHILPDTELRFGLVCVSADSRRVKMVLVAKNQIADCVTIPSLNAARNQTRVSGLGDIENVEILAKDATGNLIILTGTNCHYLFNLKADTIQMTTSSRFESPISPDITRCFSCLNEDKFVFICSKVSDNEETEIEIQLTPIISSQKFGETTFFRLAKRPDFFLVDVKLSDNELYLLFVAADRSLSIKSRLVRYKLNHWSPPKAIERSLFNAAHDELDLTNIFYKMSLSTVNIALAGRDSVLILKKSEWSKTSNIVTNTVGYKYVNHIKIDEFGIFLSHAMDCYLTTWNIL